MRTFELLAASDFFSLSKHHEPDKVLLSLITPEASMFCEACGSRQFSLPASKKLQLLSWPTASSANAKYLDRSYENNKL